MFFNVPEAEQLQDRFTTEITEDTKEIIFFSALSVSSVVKATIRH